MLRRPWPFEAHDGIPILMYHHLGKPPRGAVAGHYVSPRLFAGQLRALARRGYQAVTMDEVAEYLATGHCAVSRPVAITFDDGYESLYHLAWPALRTAGFTATIFLVAGYLGKRNDWEQPPTGQPMLQPAQVQEMAAGGITFGSHTLGHAHLDRLPPAYLAAELGESRRILEELTGRPVRHLAYPYGGCSPAVVAAARAAGYLTACTTCLGVARPGGNPLLLPRINVRRYNLPGAVLRKLRRAYDTPGSRLR